MDIRTLLALYQTHRLAGKASAVYYARLFAQVMPVLYDEPADTIDRLVLLAWYTPMKQTKPGHANKALGGLRAAYNWAIQAGLLHGHDPTVCLTKSPEPMRAVTTSPEEWAKIVPFLEDCRLRPRGFFHTQYELGQRPGETRTLRTADLHLDQDPPIWINGQTKTGHPNVVPLPPAIADLLRLIVRFNPPHAKYVFFGASPERPWERTSMQRMWEGIRAKAGLPHLWLNDLRRSTASDLLNQGENLGVIQRQLGHRSLSQTAKYAHLATQPLHRALCEREERIVRAITAAV